MKSQTHSSDSNYPVLPHSFWGYFSHRICRAGEHTLPAISACDPSTQWPSSCHVWSPGCSGRTACSCSLCSLGHSHSHTERVPILSCQLQMVSSLLHPGNWIQSRTLTKIKCWQKRTSKSMYKCVIQVSDLIYFPSVSDKVMLQTFAF